jgi:hypothetical protein
MTSQFTDIFMKGLPTSVFLEFQLQAGLPRFWSPLPMLRLLQANGLH